MILQNLKRPEKDEWGRKRPGRPHSSGAGARDQSLLYSHKISEKHDGPQMQNFLEQNYLHEKVEAIKELGDYVTKSS